MLDGCQAGGQQDVAILARLGGHGGRGSHQAGASDHEREQREKLFSSTDPNDDWLSATL